LRSSLEASWYSLVMVAGTGLAKARMVAKTAKLTPRPRATPQAIRALVPGGSTARGPWGPKAIQ